MVGWGALAAVAALALGGCSGDDGDGLRGSRERQWDYCSQGSDGCRCEVLAPGWESSGFGEQACSGFNCCLLTENPDESTAVRCECFDAAGSCEAEAESRRGAMRVDACPPGDEVIAGAPTECAAKGENCRDDYLAQQDLSGCCEGTVCLANEDQVPVCQEATDEQQALARVCDDVARTDEIRSLEVTEGNVSSSAGELAFDSVGFTTEQVGPGGCLTSLTMRFDQRDSALCNFELEAQQRAGQWEVVQLYAPISDCAGYVPGMSLTGLLLVDDPSQLPIDFTFEGLACDGRLIFESYCVAGRFDWHINGVIEGITFDDSHLVAEGVLCSTEPEGTCTDAP